MRLVESLKSKVKSSQAKSFDFRPSAGNASDSELNVERQTGRPSAEAPVVRKASTRRYPRPVRTLLFVVALLAGCGRGRAPPAQDFVSLTVTVTGDGIVTPVGGRICNATCTLSVAKGRPLTLWAVPSGNSIFSGWT